MKQTETVLQENELNDPVWGRNRRQNRQPDMNQG